MKKINLKKSLLEVFAKSLEEFGFSYIRQLDTFQRNEGLFRGSLKLVFLRDEFGFRIQPHVGVRVDFIEGIFHKISGFDVKSQRSTTTIGGSAGGILEDDNRACEFLLTSETEIPSVNEALVNVVTSLALPYYETYSKLENIDSELNQKPNVRTPLKVVPFLRFSTGAIVAKLMRRSDYEPIVGAYLEMLGLANNGFYLKPFKIC